VTRADDSQACGQLLDSRSDGNLRVRRPNGEIVAVPVGDLRSIKSVSTCAT